MRVWLKIKVLYHYIANFNIVTNFHTLAILFSITVSLYNDLAPIWMTDLVFINAVQIKTPRRSRVFV
jgi:hypothetical protein